ncbi:hypothetical protein L2E82_09143 [Cichorium intybus]|uniref:Uncharacterized protein n=1 Tax=Cichorium intybus TaxID=13427 RepID=A0ACB9G8M7_CICIN|nr:hypothetical protein L2E82_09143 [Cichorium intybus]
MMGSQFDFQRAESSQQKSIGTPSLDMRRAESSRQHVRALNNQFASKDNENISFQEKILNSPPSRTTPVFATSGFRPSWSTGPLFNNNTSFSIGGQNSISLKTDASNDVDGEPSSPSVEKTEETGILVVHEVNCNLYVKATAGGGGLGMCLAKEHDEFVKLLQQPQSEAAAAFGIDGVYLEKYIQNPRHIEFQMKLKA